jgi:23S rRNA pseudouridine2605 synthase
MPNARKPIQRTPKKKVANQPKAADDGTIRLNKYISNSGMCSRREADMHISIGSITVNGKVVVEMGYKVKPDDEVRFDGARVQPEKKLYILLNKPKGFATTSSDAKGKTVLELVANAGIGLRPVGRLGRNSTGLLLFTNDDVVMQKFTNSKHGVDRLFQVHLDKNLTFEHLKAIIDGVKIDGEFIQVSDISYIKGAPKNEVGLKIKNTGNGVLRKLFDHFKYDLIKVDCVMIGGLTKKDLPRSRWRNLTQLEINSIMMM